MTAAGDGGTPRFRVKGILGQGGMARVFRATLLGPMGYSKDVALKQIRLDRAAADPRALEALVNEARLGGRLRHPNIVETWEFCREGDSWFIAMAFVDGFTLDVLRRGLAARGAGLPLPVLLEVLEEVCRGLHYAHTAADDDGVPLDIVHRDLKPSNVILSSAGETKILDFGIAKGAATLFHTQSTTAVKGTPCYMSPEQLRGDPLDARSDLFSVGAVLYELATGERLVDTAEPAAAVFRIITGRIEQQARALDDLLPGLGEVAATCLAADPAERYADAAAVGDALRRLRPAEWAGVPGARELAPALIEVADGRPGPALARLVARAERAPPASGWPGCAESLAAPLGADDPLAASRSLVPLRDAGGLPESWVTGETGPRTTLGVPPPPPAPAPPRSRWTATLLALAGLVAVVVLVPLRCEGARRSGGAGDGIVDVEVERLEGTRGTRTRLLFQDALGTTVEEVLVSGSDPAVALWRGTDASVRRVAVGTRRAAQRAGGLFVYDVRGRTVTPAWTLGSADAWRKSPEAHRGFRETGEIDFYAPTFLGDETDSGPPQMVVLARDRSYAPTWILRLSPDGDILGRVFHAGQLGSLHRAAPGRILAFGSGNRICGDQAIPCETMAVVLWYLPIPEEGTLASLPPACDDLPLLDGVRGWMVGAPAAWGPSGVTPFEGGDEPWFGVYVKRRGGPECGMSVRFDAHGELGGVAVQPCSEPPVVTPLTPPMTEVCEEWLAKFPAPADDP